MLRKYSTLVTASIRRSGSVISLKLCVLLFVVIGQVNAAELSETSIPGLSIDSSRIKLLKVDSIVTGQSVLGRTLNNNEHWVETDNKRIKALLTISTTDHSLTLTVYNQSGVEVGRFTPNSQNIVIPSLTNQIWVAGKDRGEGYMHLDGIVNYKGLYSYSFDGKLLATVPKKDTNGIIAIKSAESRGVIVLTATELLAIDIGGSISWRKGTSSHTIVASQKGDLFGTESWDSKIGSRAITLYGLDGAVLYSVTDTTESRISVIGISKNSRYVAIRKFISAQPLKWNVAILEVIANKKISSTHAMTINGGPMQVEVSDDAGIFGLVVNERLGDKFKQKASLIDNLGNKLFEYVLVDTDTSNMKISIDNENMIIKKPSGDIRLEIVGPAP